MKITIKTKDLQALLDKSIKGSGRKPSIKATNYMSLEVKGADLVITTIDGINILEVTGKELCSDKSTGFYACVMSNQFYNLVKKLTKDITTLEVTDRELKVSSNGEYSFALILTESGSVYKFDQINVDGEVTTKTIANSDVKSILEFNKASVEKDAEEFIMNSYYTDNAKVITYNGFTICKTMCGISSQPMLLSASLIELFTLFGADNVNVEVYSNFVRVFTDNINIYSKINNNVEKYRVESYEMLFTNAPESTCTVNKQELVGILDRMQIFVNDFVNNGAVKLIFENDTLTISDKAGRNKEVLNYVDKDVTEGVTKSIVLKDLVSQLKTHTDENIDIKFGARKYLILTDNKKVYQIIPFLQEA